MIEITIKADNVAHLRLQLSELLGTPAVAAPAPAPAPVAEKPKETKAKSDKPAPETKTTATPAPEQATEAQNISTGEERIDPAQAEQKAAEGETYDYDSVVMPLVLEAMAVVNDREWIIGKIREYGGPEASKASQIPADKMGAFVAEFRQVVATKQKT